MLSNSVTRWLGPLPVIFALLAWLAIAGIGGPAGGKLSSVQKNDQSLFVPSSADSTKAAELIAQFETDDSVPALIVFRPETSGAVTAAQISEVQERAAQIPELVVEGSNSTWSEYLIGTPIAAPSADMEALLIIVGLDSVKADSMIGDKRASVVLVNDIRAALDDNPIDGLQSWVTGPAGFVADLVTAFAGIDGVLLFTALGAVLVILVVVYRSPLLPVVVMGTAIFALAAAGLLVYLLAEQGVLVLNGQAQGILAILVVGASVDYSLLLVARYREELTRYEEPAVAMARALRGSIEPIAASAATVVAAVLCLLLSELGSNRSLGPVAAIGIVTAFAAAMTLLPALLLIAGRRSRILFWPRAPHIGEQGSQTGPWAAVAKKVVDQARVVWPVATVLLLVLGGFAFTLVPTGTNQTDIFLTKVEAVAGQEVLADHFPAGAAQPAHVIVREAERDVVVEAADGVKGVASVTVTSPPGSPNPIVIDGKVRIDVVTDASADSQQAADVVAELRDAVHDAAPDALVGGVPAVTLDTRLAAERDLRVVVPTVLIVIAVILAFLLRSVVAPLILLAANVVSFAAAIGVSALVFQHLAGWPTVDPTVPLYGFVFLVALGVDYSIFLMTRVREETTRSDTATGVVVGLRVTGGVITSAGLVLATTFAALAVIPLLFLAQLAFIVAFGVILDTFVVRTLLVPGIVVHLGDRTWWPWPPKKVSADVGQPPNGSVNVGVGESET